MMTGEEELRFSRAYGQYGAMLYRIGLMHTGSPADAEDVLHDVFLRLLGKAPRFRDELHEKRWLIRVTVNLCHNRRNSAAARKNVPLHDALSAPDGGSDQSVRDAIRALPPKLRDVIYLHCVEGYSAGETASLLGTSVSAVKMRLSRAREKLKLDLDICETPPRRPVPPTRKQLIKERTDPT